MILSLGTAITAPALREGLIQTNTRESYSEHHFSYTPDSSIASDMLDRLPLNRAITKRQRGPLAITYIMKDADSSSSITHPLLHQYPL